MSDLHWTTAITKIEPNKISVRGYPLADLLGKVSYAQMVHLLFKGGPKYVLYSYYCFRLFNLVPIYPFISEFLGEFDNLLTDFILLNFFPNSNSLVLYLTPPT